MKSITIVDSHTGGEPTRVVIAGGPDLGSGDLSSRLERFRSEFDAYRRAVICEPRGSDVLVGALLVPPTDPACVAAVIFFNNVGYLGMCGHGTIGVGVTLGHLGRITAGKYLLETPVGIVPFEYDGRNSVALENVPSYCLAPDLHLDIPGLGKVVGDVAWGGNWFFLVHEYPEKLERANVAKLTEITTTIRQALRDQGITGSKGEEIDHVELFGPPHDPNNHGRNFVLCPGGAYDRSPCGTGTSANIACLAHRNQLQPGEVWRQESVLGSVFEASYRRLDDFQILPTIQGQAFITAEAKLLIDENDRLAWGVES
jgi:4-hydroxyproline epimerase